MSIPLWFFVLPSKTWLTSASWVPSQSQNGMSLSLKWNNFLGWRPPDYFFPGLEENFNSLAQTSPKFKSKSGQDIGLYLVKWSIVKIQS